MVNHYTKSNSSSEEEFYKFEIMVNFFYQPQYYLFILVSIYRVCIYWDAGQFNSKFAPRSCTYVMKVFLQMLMVFGNISQIITIR